MRIILLFCFILSCKLFYAQTDSISKTDTLLSQSPKPGILIADTLSICSINYCDRGIASYYGRQFNGRLTSSGERFDMYKYTAAHKTLPLGTYVVVTNLSNNKSIIVKINDRMPPWNKREIDLAQGAAGYLDYIGAGLTNVQIEIYKPKLAYK